MYVVHVNVLRLYIWVWLVSLVCIIKLYPMLVLIKPFVESCYNNQKPWMLVFFMVNYDLHSSCCFVDHDSDRRDIML